MIVPDDPSGGVFIPMVKNRDNLPQKTAFVLGLTSIIGQVLLLRELITVFYGNETAYAIILASWLFWISVGSYAASLPARRIKNPSGVIAAFQWGVYFLLPLTVISTRCIKQFMHIQAGEITGIIPACVISYVLLAPLTFLLGGLFTLTCLLPARHTADTGAARHIGNIYIWESAGATAGGLIFSFVLIPLLPALHTAFLIGAVNIGAGLFLHEKKGWTYRAQWAVALLTIAVVFSGLIDRLDNWTRRMQWEGLEVVATADSVYGNIAMTRMGEEYSLYESGLLSYTTRDDLTSEEGVHFPLLEHPHPRRVLLIGKGAGGSLREILKHPGSEVDYVELDPKIIEVSKKYLPSEYLEPFQSDRVRVIYTDGRGLVKRTTQRYDVVIVNLSDPYTALINRYYTLEFFKEVNRVLNPGGILALSVSSSENYLNEEAKAFLRSVNTTLKKVFTDVRSVPGDTNIFLACTQKNILTRDPQLLMQRLNERRLKTTYVREYYLPYKLSPDRIFYIEEALKEDGAINTDTRPVAYLYDIILWSTHFDTAFKHFIIRFQGIKFYHLLILPLLVFGIGLLAGKLSPASPVTLSIMTTGFSEIIFQLIVIIAFQTLYGYAYYKIGLIMASFMGGLVLGSLMARRIIARMPSDIPKIYKMAQLAVCLYPLLLPVVFVVFRDAAVTERLAGIFAGTFALLPVVAGFIGGLQYPLAAHLLCLFNRDRGEPAARPAGFLYAVDVLGAMGGALITGTLLIPLLGIPAAAVLCAVLNGVVWILLYPAKLSPDV